MEVPAQDLAAVPPWLAISVLATTILVPIATAVAPRLIGRRRRRDTPDEDPDPAQTHQVDAVAEALDELITDLQSQRRRLQRQVEQLQRERDEDRDESAAKDVTIARLQAQLEACRQQQRSGPP